MSKILISILFITSIVNFGQSKELNVLHSSLSTLPTIKTTLIFLLKLPNTIKTKQLIAEFIN